MKSRTIWLSVCAAAALAAATSLVIAEDPATSSTGEAASGVEKIDATNTTHPTKIKSAAISPFVTKGIAWLIKAQGADGGWGGGSHAHQEVRDPHKVPTDPATTAFTLLTLLRTGNTPTAGESKEQVRRGLEYLIAAVEKAPTEGPKITDLTGTQLQVKLGPIVDTSLTAQYLARAVDLMDKADPLYERTDKALDKCLAKLQASQQKDGGWGQHGGWAPVLQSSLSCSALEIAQANGKAVDTNKLALARSYQQRQVTTTPAGGAAASTGASAGIELYAYSGSFRGNASESRSAQKSIQDAVEQGKLKEGAEVSVDNLNAAGIERRQAQSLARAFAQNDAQIKRLDDEKLLAGFGNNGGEEYLSYLLTSESLVIAAADKFNQWNDKMHGRLQKIQNSDGSWAGQHCITSPVFCTAAVVQCLTTDRDAEFLIAMAERTHNAAEKVAEKTETEKK
jgi:hypothetical protein